MAITNQKQFLRHIVARGVVKLMLRPFLRWPKLHSPESGYSILLGVPWDLRHLLSVNLQVVERCDLEHLVDLHLVFDRCHRPEMDEIIETTRERFADLPIRFHHYPAISGTVIELANICAFYHAMSSATALAACRTRWAILHDFDLYPLRPDYFEEIWDQMRERDLRFCGVQRINRDGLTDHDNVFGTWALGMDVAWLRNERKVQEVFHRAHTLDHQRVNLDPFAWLQLQTKRGEVEGFGSEAMCHVTNLCGTYLRFLGGQQVKLAWRLHYLWYLEELAGRPEAMQQAIAAMQEASATGTRTMKMNGRRIDFDDVDPSCADVLRNQVRRLEALVHNGLRAHIQTYLDTVDRFLGWDKPTVRAEHALHV